MPCHESGPTSDWYLIARKLEEPLQKGMQMTALAPSADAPFGNHPSWSEIDWAKAEREVRRLQARIAKASREGRRRTVHALQWLLDHSFSGKALAVRRVTQNRGKATPGVDGVVWSTPESKTQALESLGRKGYKPKPLRRVLIPKSNGKMRPLGIPTMKDRAMQALHLLGLIPVAEMQGDRNSYGFRPERSTADAREQIFKLLAKKTSPKWILEGD